jgi:hypothetical protein
MRTTIASSIEYRDDSRDSQDPSPSMRDSSRIVGINSKKDITNNQGSIAQQVERQVGQFNQH